MLNLVLLLNYLADHLVLNRITRDCLIPTRVPFSCYFLVSLDEKAAGCPRDANGSKKKMRVSRILHSNNLVRFFLHIVLVAKR